MTMHSAALLAKGMPATFPTAFTAAKDAFVAQRAVFKDKEKVAKEGIKAKFEANEAIYASLVMMTEAGKVIYKTNEFERNNFIIAKLLREVRGNSPSGIKGMITTGTLPVVPLKDVLVFDQNDPERFTMTDEEGKYEFRIPSGKQKMQVEAVGYVTQVFERKIDVGTLHRKSFSLVLVPVMEAAPATAPVVPSNGKHESSTVTAKANGVLQR